MNKGDICETYKAKWTIGILSGVGLLGLLLVGLLYSYGWHNAHHWNSRHVVPDSIMPSSPWLFEPIKGNEIPQLNDNGKALMAYVQKLGTGIGDWKENFLPTRVSSGVALHVNPGQRDKLVSLGKAVYQLYCIGCHGKKGDGNGQAAVYLDPKPRDFTRGIFKFRSTPGKDSLPTDADLFITITHGLSGTPMWSWAEISKHERFAVIQYIKTFSDRWKREKVGVPITITSEPSVTRASIQNGEKLFHSKATCFMCHGATGKGDGVLAATLKDVWGHPVHPANFTLPAGVQGGVELGHDGEHIFKTIMTGVGGTPMPAFQGTLKPDEVWDIVHYEQSLRVTAHGSELIAEGLKDEDLADALSGMWQELSVSASQGRIEPALLEQELSELKLGKGPVDSGQSVGRGAV